MNNNYIKVKVSGKNVNNYLKWLISKKINIINLKIVSHNEMHIIINYRDLSELSKYSKTYKITIEKKYGKLKVVDAIKKNSIIISTILLSIVLLYFLSNIIFSVEVVYNNQDLSNMLIKELAKYNIKKYSFKKDYKYLEEVKKKILSDKKDELEWIEIEESGTKYLIKVVERKKEDNKEEYTYQSIVAAKDGILKSIKAYSGEKNKAINEYIKKDETIISGVLSKPDGTNLYVKAKGTILAEVWYKVSVEYPMYYQEESVTGRSKTILSLNFINKRWSLFNYSKYKQFKMSPTIIIENKYLPITIAKEKLYEVNIKEDIYTEEDATIKAIEISKQKLLENNSKISEITETIVLNKENLGSKIKLNLFISVLEDITKIIEITEEIPQTNK